MNFREAKISLKFLICLFVLSWLTCEVFFYDTTSWTYDFSFSKKASVISCSSHGVSDSNVYDEIESDAVRDQRMSVLTIDNPYVTMPKSASPRGPSDSIGGTVTYYNTEETVFVFDNLLPGGQGQIQKESDASQNTSNNLTVPRHMSVDSTGYLMPGNALERAARRHMKYTKNV